MPFADPTNPYAQANAQTAALIAQANAIQNTRSNDDFYNQLLEANGYTSPDIYTPAGVISNAPGLDAIARAKSARLASTGLANLLAERAVLPEQLRLQREFAPQLASAYGDTLSAFYKAVLPQWESTLGPTINRINSDAQSWQRGSDIGDVLGLSPALRQAWDAYDPQSAELIRRYMQTVMGDWSEDPNAFRSPAGRRADEQIYRSSDRGLNLGTGGQFGEALAVYAGNEQAKQRWLDRATGAVGLSRGFYADPLQSILGRPSNTAQLTPGYAGTLGAQGGQGGVFNSTDAFNNPGIGDIWSGLFQLDQNARNAGAAKGASNNALAGAGLSAAGGIGAALIGAAAAV